MTGESVLIKAMDWMADLVTAHSKRKDAAGEILRKACNETDIYFGRARNGVDVTLDQQEQLSRLWNEVATKWRHIDREVETHALELSTQFAKLPWQSISDLVRQEGGLAKAVIETRNKAFELGRTLASNEDNSV